MAHSSGMKHAASRQVIRSDTAKPGCSFPIAVYEVISHRIAGPQRQPASSSVKLMGSGVVFALQEHPIAINHPPQRLGIVLTQRCGIWSPSSVAEHFLHKVLGQSLPNQSFHE